MPYLKSVVVGMIGAGCMAAATAAFAQPPQISDASYFQAERCQALIASSALGHQDSTGIDRFLKAQDRTRDGAAYDRGQDARHRAAQQAQTAGAFGKSQLIAERDGVCQGFTAGPSIAASSSRATSSSN